MTEMDFYGWFLTALLAVAIVMFVAKWLAKLLRGR